MSSEPEFRPSGSCDSSELDAADPGVSRVQQFLIYGLSLPERMLRSTTAVVGGAIRESSMLLVPQAFRSSRTYSVFVQQMLDFLVSNVGGVNSTSPSPGQGNPQVENFVARKAVGNFIDLAGLATLHLSPLTVLALISDIAYGSQTYLKELSEELKKNGVIDKDTTIDHAADLLEAVSRASAVTSKAFDTPPLSVDGLKETIQQTRDAVTSVNPMSVIPKAEVERIWDEMHQIARQENVGVWEISSAISMYTVDKVGTLGQGALSTVKVAGNMFDRHILDHYQSALSRIREKGFYATLSESSRPYIDAMWMNFASDRATITEDVVTGRLVGRIWSGIRGWWNKPSDEAGDHAPAADPPSSNPPT